MNKQNILLIILILVLAGGVLFFYKDRAPENSENAVNDDDEFKSRLAELQRLRDLHLDTSVFRDKFFQSLRLPEKPSEPAITPGRSNPFFLP